MLKRSSNPKIQVVLGTRPEIIKMAPVIHELKRRNLDFEIVHTGQHYSENMDRIFWENFDLPAVAHHLGVQEKTHASQTARMLLSFEEIFLKARPDWVLVQGDTNTAMCGALAAAKIPGVRVGHVEAGLRSHDRSMPEEINRRICDHISDLLFPPTQIAADFLRGEGLGDRCAPVTGNTIEDALLSQRSKAQSRSILQKLNLASGSFVLLTVHRQENTNHTARLISILESVSQEARTQNLKVVFPIHPRTLSVLREAGYQIPEAFLILEPVDYLDFLKLQSEARLIATDSGGVQEEACILKIPCLTLRENTERQETIAIGANILAGVSPEGIRRAFQQALQSPRQWQSPYGGGVAAAAIVDGILSAHESVPCE